jgi:hypothetical protein
MTHPDKRASRSHGVASVVGASLTQTANLGSGESSEKKDSAPSHPSATVVRGQSASSRRIL